MSNKPTAQNSKNKKSSVKTGLSTFTKIILSLILILAICVAGFIFHAWQVIKEHVDTDTTVPAASSIEVLTPNGAPASQPPVMSTSTFDSNPTTIAASDEVIIASDTEINLPDITSRGTPSRATTRTKINEDDGDDMKPILPINVPPAPAKDNSINSSTVRKPKPANNTNNNKPLDNLF